MNQTKLSQIQRLIQDTIQERRIEDGFPQRISALEWATDSVSQKVLHASYYFVENCCEKEGEELRCDPRPDDDGLEDALYHIERALNGLMIFDLDRSDTRESEESEATQSKTKQKEISVTQTAEQSSYAAAALNYLHWLMEGDDWTKDFRKNLPFPLTEKQMVDFLLSPLTEVLSFEDFRSLGLCPVCTTGRVVLKSQTQTPITDMTEAERYLVRSGKREGHITSYEFAVEVDRPDGSVAQLNLSRRGTIERKYYRSILLDEHWNNVSHLADGSAIQGMWQVGFGEGLLDRNLYPDFPNFVFRCYPGSIAWQVQGYCETLVENEFYNEFCSALRYLLMYQGTSQFDFVARTDSIYVPQWLGFMGGKYHLSIPPWVLPEELADYWRQIRPARARERRLPSTTQLEIFDFVLQHTAPGTWPRWAELARTWGESKQVSMTRDRLYKVYYSVLQSLFPSIDLSFSQKTFNYADKLYAVTGKRVK